MFLFDSLKLSNPRRLSKLYQKMYKNFENWRVLCFLSFSVSIWDIVTKKTAKNCSEKPTGQHIRALLTLFNVSIHKIYRNFRKNCIKSLEIRKFWDFVHFGVNLRHFQSKHWHFFFIKDYWTTNCFFWPYQTFQNKKTVGTLSNNA